jgi:anaerobic selenocysteine-containing dehydrogenase
MSLTTAKTFCRFCHANCAIEVDIEDGKPVAIRGDTSDPVFGGYTCIKGRQLAVAHTHPERLTQCQSRSGPIATETALDEIAAKLRTLIDTYGPRSVAVYSGTYAFQNSATLFVAGAFAKGLGTPNYFTSVTLDQPAKVYTTLRMGSWGGGMHSFSDADAVMIIGNNAIVSQYSPPGGIPPFSPSKRLNDAKAKGTKIIVIDPRQTEVAKRADIHLQVKPGEDPALLAGMLKVILDEGLYDKAFCQQFVDGVDALHKAVSSFTAEYVAKRCEVNAADVVAAARIFAKAKKGIASSGTGPEMAGRGTMVEYLINSLNIICGRFNREGEVSPIPRVFTAATPRKAQVNPPMKLWGDGFAASRFRGLTQLGEEMPCNVLADEILTPGEGQIKALICIGGNPVMAFPDQHKITKAMESLELLVTIDIRMSQTAKLAHYVLAPTMCLERDDITILSEWWYEEPYARYARQLVEPPGDLQDEWEMLWGLAKRLGTSIPLAGGALPMESKPSKLECLDLITAGCRVPPSRVREDTADAAAFYWDQVAHVEPGDPDGGARFTLEPDDMVQQLEAIAAESFGAPEGYSHLLISRRTKSFFNSTGHDLPALAAKGTSNYAHMHPDDMAALGLADESVIQITGKQGAIFGVAKAAPDVKRGVISMAHAFGVPDQSTDTVRQSGGSTNRLVSDVTDFDPITGQARQSAIPVSIRAMMQHAAE